MDTAEDDEEEPDTETDSGGTRSRPVELVADQPLLAVRVVSDEEMDTAEDDEEEPDTETDSGGTRSRPVELVADQPLLAVRVVLYDPRKLGRDDEVEPQIQFSVMFDWKVDSDEATDGQQFTLDRSMLRRVPLSLGAGVGTGHASRLQINASVKSVKHVVGAKHKKISLFHRRIRWQNKENTT